VWKGEEMKTIEIDQECNSCDATGLYTGMAEADGAAIVCSRCKGTGKYRFVHKYTDFTERKDRSNIERVYEVNPGIGIGKGNGHTLEEFGGMPYKDWVKGKPFEKDMENRCYTCPAWWYQSADYNKKPEWAECNNFGAFSDCKQYKNKDRCWKRFDMEVENDL
jgi:hypothetical protein